MGVRTLTELEVRVLDHAAGVVTSASIREAFGWREATFYQRLYVILDLPAALQRDAVLVHRLQRLREERAAARARREFRRAG